MKIIGERLKLLRDGIKLSQSKIANLIGTSQVSINRYENDNGDPPLSTLLWYADYFDVSLDFIFGRTEKPQGRDYEFKPKFLQDNEQMKLFIEMCFDPNSSMNERLKETLYTMLYERSMDKPSQEPITEKTVGDKK